MIRMSDVGTDLAELVLRNNLPTAEVDSLKFYGPWRVGPLFDETLRLFSKYLLNSPILVGGESEIVDGYFNTLALKMTEHDLITKRFFEYLGVPINGYAAAARDEAIARLVGKRLHTFDIQQFLSIDHGLKV